MRRYNCPICDRPIKGQYYCSFCRQFVKNAYVSNADYYLNERHPASESDCTYHSVPGGNLEERKSNQPDSKTKAGGQTMVSTRERINVRPQAEKKTQEQQRVERERQIQTTYSKPAGQFRLNIPENGRKVNSGGAAIGWTIFAIVFIINVFSSCIT